jgi:hypothetical protein
MQSDDEKVRAVEKKMASEISFGQQIFLGALVADSIAMPVHWYYNQSAIERDFGILDAYQPPKKNTPRQYPLAI